MIYPKDEFQIRMVLNLFTCFYRSKGFVNNRDYAAQQSDYNCIGRIEIEELGQVLDVSLTGKGVRADLGVLIHQTFLQISKIGVEKMILNVKIEIYVL